MKISGYSIAWNACKYNYPIVQAIRSILPICDEFVINIGYSDDGTLELIQSMNEPKIRIIESHWDRETQKPDMLSYNTNVALDACTGDWAFYVQADEIIHEADLSHLKNLMEKYLDDPEVDAFRFKWLHFYGSYYRYRVDYGWFQKQERIIRNNGTIESCTDAWTFRRKDGQPLKIKHTDRLLYHYGWVHPGEIMTQKRVMAENIYAPPTLTEEEKTKAYEYGDLNRFPAYFGSHPAVMRSLIKQHPLSRRDYADIQRRYWWHPMNILKARYKTWQRVKTAIK